MLSYFFPIISGKKLTIPSADQLGNADDNEIDGRNNIQ
jgi:hypothetical protein